MKRYANINLEQDKIHVMQLAAQFNKNPATLFQQIEAAQKSNRKLTFAQLKKNNPVLYEFDKLLIERSKAIGFKAEQIDKILMVKAREIIKDKKLYAQLQNELPNLAQSVAIKIKSHGLDINQER